MRKLLMFTAIALLVLAGTALANKETAGEITRRVNAPCGLLTITHDWDFTVDPHGFTTAPCDAQGNPVWEYGATTYIPGAPGNVWGTVLNSDYLNDSGEGLLSPPFVVAEATLWVEVDHYYDIETNYDGGNLMVNGVVIPPVGGYDATLSTSTYYYAWCVDLEDGFTGHDATWRTDCWDLSQFLGEQVQLEFDFGSDSSVTYPGWYLAAVRVGTTLVPNDEVSWGAIKGLYK